MRWLVAVSLVAAACAGCLGSEEAGTVASDEPAGSLSARSSAFDEGAPIPERYTCEGEGVSPPLDVTGLPNGTATLALIVGDPDVPTPEIGAENFTHWLLWNARPADQRVVFPEAGTPNGSVEGANDGGGEGYTGPCPPVGSPPHRYVFTFFAVDTRLGLGEGADRSELEQALDGHVIEETVLVGTYERSPT